MPITVMQLVVESTNKTPPLTDEMWRARWYNLSSILLVCSSIYYHQTPSPLIKNTYR